MQRAIPERRQNLHSSFKIMANNNTPEAALALIQQFLHRRAAKFLGRNFVLDLARKFKQETFQVSTRPGDAGEVRMSYWVGMSEGQSGIRFNSANLQTVQRIDILSALVVAVLPGGDLAVTKKTFGKDSVAFKTNQWSQLDLSTNKATRFVLTTQLSGCTFAIGSVDNHYYVAHAQPDKDSVHVKTGKELAKSLSKGVIFQDLPKKLDSTFFIDARDTKVDKEHVGYSDDGTRVANVLGLVHGGKLFFIVTVVNRNTRAVEKVYVVSQEGASKKWTSTPVT